MIDYQAAVKDSGARILLCEPDLRIIHAAHELKKKHGLQPVLVGDEQAYREAAQDERLLNDLTILPVEPERFADEYHQLREHKGISREDAKRTLEDPAFYSCMLLHAGEADGLVCGASWPTANTLRPALQVLADGLASSYFLMQTPRGEYVFGDCAMNIQPSAEQLTEIAKNTAYAAQQLGMDITMTLTEAPLM